MNKRHLALSAALILCLVGTTATMAQVADLDIGSNGVIWQPLTADKMVLTISGPSGDFRHELDAGEKPAFEMFDKNGALLQDGSYTWELVTLPQVDDATRAAMMKARESGEAFTGTAPQGLRQSGSLSVQGGYFVLPSQEATKPAQLVEPNKDQVINDDLIVTQSACVGQDCVNGESFGFDTIRLKENNLRIKFQDTSNSASFPTNDWQLTANDTTNGGQNKFSIDDIDGGRTPFTIEASAPSHSLYVDDGGRVGLGKSTPVVELHITNGDTPTVRLEQDGSSGFTAQTWDLASNETNFFIRDATNGSRLPFKIIPSAPTNSLVIQSDGDIGLGTASPAADLHVVGDALVQGSDGTTTLVVRESSTTASTAGGLLQVDAAQTGGTVQVATFATSGTARPRLTMTHGGAGTWNFDILNTTGNFAFIRAGGFPEYTFVASNGNLEIDGVFVSNGMTLAVPDFVFADDYNLMPLDDVKAFIEAESHLPEIPSAEEVKAEGLDLTTMQLKLLQKVEELTLYTLEQHETNRDQESTIRDQQSTIQELMERLEALEAAQP